MAHGVRIRKDNAWAVGSIWTDAERLALDGALNASLNGDGGGIYFPTAPIVIGGAGICLLATEHTIAGAGAAVTTSLSQKTYLVHGDSDYCELGPGHTGGSRVIQSSVQRAIYNAGWVTCLEFLSSSAYGATAQVPLDVHDGAQFNSVVFNFRVAFSNGEAPDGTPPRFGVFADDGAGNVYPLNALMPYQGLAPFTSVSQWFANGLPQTFGYACDSPTTNPYVVVDTARFTYYAEIIEATSPLQANFLGATWFGDPQSSFVNIADLAPQ